MTADHVDLFAGGLGGFSWAGRALGYTTLGIEWDDAAVATREAAGLATLQADVSALDPLDFAPIVGLSGGPPCQSYSSAGKGEGRAALDFYADAITRMGAGDSIDVAELDAACGDERAHLVLEPLRWALALRPRWVACEQVPPVLPLWEAMATALREHGYWTWTGLLSSETFGVPQTRLRAFMLASLDGPVTRPPATHQRYIAPRRRVGAMGGLFALPDAERIVAPEDRGLLPWVSMAAALQWEGAAYRLARGEGMSERHGERPDTPMTEPAPTISGKVRSASWTFRANAQSNACERGADEPAPTITGGHDHNERARLNDVSWVQRSGQTVAGEGRAERPVSGPSLSIISRTDLCSWVPAGQARNSGPGAERDPRPLDAPSYTIRGAGSGSHPSGVEWVESRPATTVNGDPRISEPGYHDSDVSGSQQANAVRVSEAEALVLQSYSPDYPLRGSKSARFLTIGNAIPYLLALAVLRAVASDATREATA